MNHDSKDIVSNAAICACAADEHVDVHRSRAATAAAAGATVAMTEYDSTQRHAMMYFRTFSIAVAEAIAARSDLNDHTNRAKNSAMISNTAARDDMSM